MIYIKIRTEGKVNFTEVLIAIGLKEDGYRDVLGLHLENKVSYYIFSIMYDSTYIVKEKWLSY